MIEGALASEVSHCVATGLRVVARIPCYNEEVTIGPTVAAFCGAQPLATVCAYRRHPSNAFVNVQAVKR